MREQRAMPGQRLGDSHAEVWSNAKAAFLEQIMRRQFQEWLDMVSSEFFPDWAREEIVARMGEGTLDLGRLSEIVEEARGDMFDLQVLAEEPDIQETYTLTQLEQYLKTYDELHPLEQ